MNLMTEQYHSGGGNTMKRLSRSELKKMKENMQKTPLIQKKSDSYHRIEEKRAEHILHDFINEDTYEEEKKVCGLKQDETNSKISLFHKIKKYLFG